MSLAIGYLFGGFVAVALMAGFHATWEGTLIGTTVGCIWMIWRSKQ